ncbi:MAG: tRNA (N(6)-L-threonylcarbamoyladenosine(37)-C(2))-methylthiotransferase MtaB [Bdellovibrionales bacterium]|nr:tRNA (N(6)-L-threonylcarbamoyladenosine(37)-C(2))-methylthiotransferase MtaB [Bdellovibrionales bacterium]
MAQFPQPIDFEIKTFGCKVNSYDTGLMEQRLETLGFERTKLNKDPKVYILNTCAVTAEATKEAVRHIRKIKAQSPFSKIVVTGCAAQVDTGAFSELPSVDLIVANSHKQDLETLLSDMFKGKLKQRVFKSNIFKKEDLGLGGGEESRHTRSFLKIQDGCNSFCTFCVIPFARGKSRSLPIPQLIEKIQSLYEQGVREVVLTGVHIGDYEFEGKKLEDLLEAILEKTKMPRFRLTSLEPIELNERLFSLYTHEKMCPHFHISLQSAQSDVLRGMKRNYSHQEVEWALNEIHNRFPKAFVGMDIIAGFPGETVEMFNETLQRMSELPWTRMHVFPYSPREGTYATRLQGQWSRSEIMERAKKLRSLSQQRFDREAKKQWGDEKKVLILGDGKRGLSRDYWTLQLPIDVQLPKNDEILIKVGPETPLICS